MRLLLLTVALLAVPASAAAQSGPNAREAYVERRGLLEADAQCRLLSPSIRDALQVSAAQTRGALLRAGWSNAQMRELENAVVTAARQRACNDQRTAASVGSVSRIVAQWVNAGSMEFPGWERLWIARRISEGWRLSQAIEGPTPAIFGVRQAGGAQRLTLAVPISGNAAAPASARLILRDRAQPRSEVSLNQRVARGLEAGAPPPGVSVMAPSTRSIERLGGGRSQALFIFPDSAFRDLIALDPRETVVIELQTGRATQRLLVEVGDVDAARAFLTIRR
ncbi:MAG TPA: hypothetical protein VEA80_16980 [Vitreimonas sp.]|uniref:hypothetical protein n=1 Tax=Vitreimonas sp. TaxID=3069702 RepID=UPI002D2D5A5B|nr:hypothetical protein [Vitreimonas sp.]HYD89175.1 hypothetical protein [Vitreimonas sp.]